MSSWRNSTKREYKCYISRWFQYCDRHQISRFSVSVKHVIEFLTEQYNNGLGYSALNTARGALSSLEIRLDNFAACSHPTVVRFMKGVFNLRTPVARYTETWNVDLVLKYLRRL